MTGQTAQTVPNDALTTVVEKVVIATAVSAVVLVALPLVVPVVATRAAGEQIATRAQFWVTARWQPIAATAGILVVLALLGTEALLLSAGIRDGSLGWEIGTVEAVLPWLVGNLAAGVLLLPVAWLIHRRKIATRVRTRRVSDVMRQTRIEAARKRAADLTVADRIGVQLDPGTGKIRGTRPRVITAPAATGGGPAFAMVTRPTIASWTERLHDRREVRDWIDSAGSHVVFPEIASAVRALVIAESGSGKTVLLDGMMLCALSRGWPVFFLDAKGDPADAEHLIDLAAAVQATASSAARWNLFAGTAEQVTTKLMRLMPPPDGANQHYLDEIRGVLQAIQDQSPVRSVSELRERLTTPGPWLRDQYDLQMVTAPVDRAGATAGSRALQALLVGLRPLERLIDPDGWSYGASSADLTIASLSPVDDAQARLGDLLMLDLRNFLADRLSRGDKTPVLIVVDEFPQLVTDTSDPGDTAGSLFETARSAGVGLILATQSPAGLSNDEVRRRRALTSGAALIFGRSKDPEEVVQYAGTVMQMESSGTAAGDELRSARAQHTYVVPPQDVREAADGSFWLVQGGAIATFRALPTPATTPTPIQSIRLETDTTDRDGEEPRP